MNKLIYLASPYSNVEWPIREARFRAVCLHAARMVAAGELVYCPIAHSHPLTVSGGLDGNGKWRAWQRLDSAMLQRCDGFAVLMLPGWEESNGIAAEVAEAIRRRWIVQYREPAADEVAIVKEAAAKVWLSAGRRPRRNWRSLKRSRRQSG